MSKASSQPISHPYSIPLTASAAFIAGLLVSVLAAVSTSQNSTNVIDQRNPIGAYQALVIAPRQPGWHLGWMAPSTGAIGSVPAEERYQVLPSLTMPAHCEASSGYASPNGKWMALQINCEAGGYVQVLEVASGSVLNLGIDDAGEGEFLDWTSSGDELIILMHGLVDNSAYLVNVATQDAVKLNVPGTVYDVSLSPDGQRMIYSTTKGLGFGSQTWLANTDGSNATLIAAQPEHLIIFPRWSPDGKAVAHIRLPDSSVPFPIGELWLADGTGQAGAMAASADAGRGYRPVWSPDGSRLAFVKRENPDDSLADVTVEHLISNLYLLDRSTKTVENISGFTGAWVEQPVWSPDGSRLAFGVRNSDQAGLWQLDLATQMLQPVAGADASAVPLWITNPDNSEGSK